MKIQIKIGVFLFVCCLLTSSVFAGGFQIYQAGSSEAKALGAAVVARDDLISAAWYNPAAVMGYKDRQYSSGYSFALIEQSYDPGSGHAPIKNEKKTHIIPNSHYIHPMDEKHTLVLSMYVPYGLGMKWSDDEMKRLASTGLYNDKLIGAGQMLVKGLPTEVDLQVPYFNACVTTKASSKFSVSGGLSIMRADFKLRILSQVNNSVTNAALSQTVMKYQANGWGLGYILAGHYKMNQDWNLGFRYLSKADVDMKGTVEDYPQIKIARMKGDLNLPSNFTFGVSNSSVDKWVFSFDILWTEWSRFKELKIEPRDSGQLLGGLNAKKDWDDTLAYRFGAEYRYSDIWIWRGGYVYDNSPVPDSTRSFELPGADGHIFSFGFTRKGQVWDMDFGYSYMALQNEKGGIDALNGAGTFNKGANHFASVNFSRAF